MIKKNFQITYKFINSHHLFEVQFTCKIKNSDEKLLFLIFFLWNFFWFFNEFSFDFYLIFFNELSFNFYPSFRSIFFRFLPQFSINFLSIFTSVFNGFLSIFSLSFQWNFFQFLPEFLKIFLSTFFCISNEKIFLNVSIHLFPYLKYKIIGNCYVNTCFFIFL